MQIEVLVRLVDVKRAFRRLLARLPDETEAGADFMVFGVNGNSLEIVGGETSELLRCTVVHPGCARVPLSVFCGIARSLRFHHPNSIAIVLSPGSLKIDRTEYRHPSISVVALGKGHAIFGQKPAKLQNL